MEFNYTVWFNDPRAVPDKPGVFERRSPGGGEKRLFSRWDGQQWYFTHPSPEGAAATMRPSLSQTHPWRGLREEAKCD